MNGSRSFGFSLIALGTTVSAANLLPQRYWIQEQLANLGSAFLAFHLLACLVLSIARSPRFRALLLGVNALLIAYYASFLAPFYRRPAPLVREDVGREIRLVYLNAAGDLDCAGLGGAWGGARPDLLAVAGAPQGGCPELGFAYSASKNGLMVLSVFPLSSSLEELGDGVSTSVLETHVSVEERALVLSLFRAAEPYDDESSYRTLVASRRLATRYRHSRDDVILVGALQATPFSSRYGKLVMISDMRNAMRGFGVVRARTNSALVPEEHVLYKGRLSVLGFSGIDARSGVRLGFETSFGFRPGGEKTISSIPST